MRVLAAMLLTGTAAAYGQVTQEVGFRSSTSLTAPLEQSCAAATSAASPDRQAYSATSQAFTLGNVPMTASRGPLKAAASRRPAQQPRGAITSPADLAGQWINQYPMYDLSLSGGSTAVITTTEGSDIVTVSNFWRSGGKITATVDAAAGTMAIKSQVVTRRTDGTTMSIAALDVANGRPLRSEVLTVVIRQDGSMLCDRPWGIFYDKSDPNGGDNPAYEKDDYANVYQYMIFERGTSTMSHVNVTRGDTTSYPVIATQISANVLQVKNFLGYGQTVNLLLNRDKTYTCRTQPALVEGSTPYYTRGDLVLNDQEQPESWSETFSFPAGSDPRLVQFGNMSLFYGRSYWVGLIKDARLNLNTAPDFPAPFRPLEGAGTQASPYLIKSVDDLCQVQERVNSNDNFDFKVISGTDTIPCSRTFTGQYLRLTADLDMSGYDFTPIGNRNHYFAGHFDGAGHTVKGLNIYGGAGYAAMFGQVDAQGSLSNLTLDNITVSTSSIYGAALASRCEGKIDNCHVRNSSIRVANGFQGAGALAGTSYGISRSTVTDCTVYAGDGYGGGLAAQAFGPVTDCHVSGTTLSGLIYNANNIPPFGGIVSTSNDAITDCSFAGSVEIPAAYYPVTIGGIVGIIQGLTKGTGITRCVAAGNFLGTMGNYASYNRVGGLAGMCAADITDSYSAGQVRGNNSRTVGSLTGMVQYVQNDEGVMKQPKFTNCYSTAWMNVGNLEYAPSATTCGELFGSSDPQNPPTVTNCYFNSDINNLGSPKHGLTTAALTSASGPEGFGDAWTFTSGAYPRLKTQLSRPVSALASSALLYAGSSTRARIVRDLQITQLGDVRFGFMVNGVFSTRGHYATIENNTLRLNNQLLFGIDTVAVSNSAGTISCSAMMAPIPWQGEGTAAEPWLITDKADMLALGKMTSESNVSFPGTYYKVTADIDMEYDDTFNGISSTNTSGRVLFHGTFDGDGHTIHKLKIGRLAWTVRPEDDPNGVGTVNTSANRATYIGLFGEIANDGIVRNVNIAADSKYEVFATAGSIAGNNYGLVENCRNYADVWGFSSWIGGIVGQVQKGGIVRDCYNAGNVTAGYRNAGGISSQSQGAVENCANTGNVSVISLYQAAGKNSIRYAGGILGGLNGGRAVNCFNSGRVFALEGYAGGIVGTTPKATTSANFANDLTGNVNIGVVESGVTRYIGGISGGLGTDGTIENNFYDASLNPMGAIESSPAPGMTGLGTRQLTSGTLPTGLETSLWSASADSYLIPAKHADEAALQAVRHQYILFADGEDRTHVSANATLATFTGLSWELLSHNGFTVSGNTLLPPASAQSVVVDTLQATLGGYKRLVPVQFIPKAPWAGEGTAASPWLITDAQLWNAIGTLMAQTGDEYEGKYFRVANDIDFAGAPIEMIAVDPTTFKGTIDGAGHSLNNYVFEATAQYQAPVGVLGAQGEIRNLTVNGKHTVTLASGSYAYTAGLVAKCYGKLTGCVNRSEISCNKGYVAGLAAYAYTGSVFTDCVNRGKVGTTASAGYIGGIAANGQEGVTYIRCGNEGTLTTTGTTGYIGGIVADSYESRFDSCYNRADINLPKVSNIGGIIGRAYGTKTAQQMYYFTGCYNTGDITGKAYLGGISAYCVSTVGAGKSQYFGCYNTGNITATSTSTSSSSPAAAGIAAQYRPGSLYMACRNSGTITISDKAYGAGGIVGTTAGVPTQALPVQIDDCHNTGEIHALGTSAYWVGGVIGHVNDYVMVMNCTNTAPVSAQYAAGGIAGAVWGSHAMIDNCWNSGDVTVDRRFAGGISGNQGVTNAKTATATISSCRNSGKIRSLSTTVGVLTTTAALDGHGIGGIAGQFPGLIEYCANFGEVEGPTMVGGILGEPVMNKTSARTRINGCYNAAAVTCLTDGVKAGITPTSQTAFWGDNNTLTNCYYATDWGTFEESHAGASALTLGELCTKSISDAWTLIGDYTLPVPASMRNDDGWKACAAAVVLHAGDSFDKVTRNFHVGLPQGVSWSIAPTDSPITQEGQLMRWKTENFFGDVTLTARCGDFSHSWLLKATATTGCDTLDADTKEVARQLWFNLDGLQTTRPGQADGNVYIVVTIYRDGTQQTRRILNR